MNPVSPFPAIVSLVLAVATSFLLMKRFGIPPAQGRYIPIDGLRGYLAFFVFIHHACVWYFYLQTGRWELPPSHLYTHFGQSSVALFFMITGFLFFSKLIDGRTERLDWGRLFVSRFLRLTPLYLFTMGLLFFIVAYLSKGVLNVSIAELSFQMFRWLGFTFLGEPDINGIQPTALIVAGVTWSLPYEWFFYFSLPLLALCVRVKPPTPFIALAIANLAVTVCIVALGIWQLSDTVLIAFLGGIAASFLVRSAAVRLFASRSVSSFVLLACVSVAVTVYPSAYGLAPLFLLFVAFALVACGNDLFGVLLSPVSRTLGEMAYSVYLVHGIALFIIFQFAIGASQSKQLSPSMYWLLVIGITPVLVCICFATFRFIERPAMRRTAVVTAYIRSRLNGRSGEPATRLADG